MLPCTPAVPCCYGAVASTTVLIDRRPTIRLGMIHSECPDRVSEKPVTLETSSGGDFATREKAVASLPAGAAHPNSLFLSHVV
jgi:hypothetical protein